ncbi:8531_t:CDS:1, partial [Racocetra persica]
VPANTRNGRMTKTSRRTKNGKTSTEVARDGLPEEGPDGAETENTAGE